MVGRRGRTDILSPIRSPIRRIPGRNPMTSLFPGRSPSNFDSSLGSPLSDDNSDFAETPKRVGQQSMESLSQSDVVYKLSEDRYVLTEPNNVDTNGKIITRREAQIGDVVGCGQTAVYKGILESGSSGNYSVGWYTYKNSIAEYVSITYSNITVLKSRANIEKIRKPKIAKAIRGQMTSVIDGGVSSPEGTPGAYVAMRF